MSAFFVLPSAAATCTLLRASATSMLVCASLNFNPPAMRRRARRPNRPPTAPPTPPALFSEKTTDGVSTKSAVTIWPPPMFESCRDSPAAASCALLHQVLHADAALDDDEAVGLLNHQSNQSDRRRQVVAAQRRQDVSCGSTTAIAPIGLSQCSRPVIPELPSVPADPGLRCRPGPVLVS